MLCTGNVPSVLLLDGRSWLNFLADVEQGHDWCELGVFPCRVTFAKGPFAERYGTQDGHARREGTTAAQRRQLGNPWPIDLTPANVRMLEAELQGTCAWSLERLKRRSVLAHGRLRVPVLLLRAAQSASRTPKSAPRTASWGRLHHASVHERVPIWAVSADAWGSSESSMSLMACQMRGA